MRGLFSRKFLFWNFVALAILKVALIPTHNLADLIAGDQIFSAQEVIAQTNRARVDNNVEALKENAVLNIAAAQKLEDMVRNQYFAHFSPTGVSPWHWFDVNGYHYSYAGENLAIGFPDAATTVAAWLNSPSHRRNLLSSSFREIGVAVAKAQIGNDSGILVVQFFGTPTSIPNVSFSKSDAQQNGIGVTLSQSDASEGTPAPTATPKQPATTLQPAHSPGPAVSTIPKTTSIQERSIVPAIIGFFNKGFTVYAYLLAIAMVGYVLFREFRKDLVMKAAMAVALFLLAVAIPLLTSGALARIG